MNAFRLIWPNSFVTLAMIQIFSAINYAQAQDVPSQTASQDELSIEQIKDQNINSDASSTNRTETIELDELIVEGHSINQPGYFDATHSSTTLTRERLERSQASNIMEVLQEIPGVSIEGGPRAGGMKVDIRGFDSNEDVLIKIDGATQNFERYRYGIGLSIDPELLKQVEVTRGAASITRGSGALGGVIEMETIDARDLLRTDESWGIRGKFGHRFNNDGKHLTLTGFARPFEFLDVLVSGVKREANDYTFPDGKRLEDSEETQLSGLAKVKLISAYSETSLAYRFSNETGLEPFDATGGVAGVGGTVLRTSKEKSATLNYRYQPPAQWLDLKASLGFTRKHLHDVHNETSSFAGVGGGIDNLIYDVWTAELSNSINFDILGTSNTFNFGTQFNLEDRKSLRTTVDGSTSPNQSQPPGNKQSHGLFLEETMYVGDFTFSAGLRWDYYNISSASLSKQLLEAQGRAAETDFTQLTPAFSASYNFNGGPVTLFYNYNEAFRSPLIDEYYGTLINRCKSFDLFKQLPKFSERPANISSAEWLNTFPALLAAAKNDPYSADNAICGDLYVPETSINHEAGIAITYDDLFDISDRLSSKLTFYYTRVENTLESLYQNTATGEISQPGIEVHHGFEFELRYDSDTWFGSFSASTLDGYRNLNYYENNSDPNVSEFTSLSDRGKQDLVDSPANKLVFTVGRKFNSYNLNIGYRLRAFDERLVTVETRDNCSFILPSCNISGKQKGYILHNLFVTWKPWERTELRLNLDNFTNKGYHLTGFGGGEGIIAPGMDIRLSFSQQF